MIAAALPIYVFPAPSSFDFREAQRRVLSHPEWGSHPWTHQSPQEGGEEQLWARGTANYLTWLYLLGHLQKSRPPRL